MSTQDILPVVIDAGSSTCKAGFSGDDWPKVIFPSVVGRPGCDATGNDVEMGRTDGFVGEYAQAYRNELLLRHPIDAGCITNWEDLVRLWHHAYSQLDVESRGRGLLLSDSIQQPGQREMACQLAFEDLGVSELLIARQPVLSMYGTGKTTGLMVICGDGVTQTVPIFDGFVLQSSVQNGQLAGCHITQYLQRLMLLSGQQFGTTGSELDCVRDVKEHLCYVAMDYSAELASANQHSQLRKSYQLPDGRAVVLTEERFKAPEALFTPDLVGLEAKSIPQLINDSIKACEIDVRRPLYSAIVLSGGSTLFPGFEDRLQKEINQLTPNAIQPKITTSRGMKYLVWIGGSILSSLTNYAALWVTKKEYDEQGSSVASKFTQ